MKVRFKRELNKNLMIIDADCENYEIRMVANNQIRFLLPVRIDEWNNEESFCYDITSKQSMTSAFAKRKMGKEEINSFLYSLDTVGTEAKRYLVDERNIITDPEYIYWDNGCENVYWTFNPSQEENNDLLKLAEFILEHTDTRDTYAVRAAYEFYKRAKTGEVDTKGLYTILKENNYETKTVYCENQTANRPKEEKESGKGKRIWGKILSLKKEATHKDEEWLKEIDKPCSEEMPFISEERLNITHENTENTSLLSKEAENTTLLCRKTGERRLVSKDNGDEISLKAYPCLIGARNPDVDIKLVNNTVSRMHAQIDLFNEKYYLYDLSSSNGTFLNGVKLESEEKEVIPGDEVCFGNARFVFM